MRILNSRKKAIEAEIAALIAERDAIEAKEQEKSDLVDYVILAAVLALPIIIGFTGYHFS